MPIFILVQSNKNILFCYRDLKTCGYLDVDDQTDLYCLHMVFIPLLNVILTEMMLTWNMHSMRTVKGSPSPNKQFIRSLVNLKKQGGEFTELLQVIFACSFAEQYQLANLGRT